MQEKISAISLARLKRKSLTDVVNEVEENLIDGKKFKSIRKTMVLTQEELAQKLDMSGSNLRRIERSNATTIRPESIRKLAGLRGISPSEQLQQLTLENRGSGMAADGEKAQESINCDLSPRGAVNGKASIAPLLKLPDFALHAQLSSASRNDLAMLGKAIVQALGEKGGGAEAEKRIKQAAACFTDLIEVFRIQDANRRHAESTASKKKKAGSQ